MDTKSVLGLVAVGAVIAAAGYAGAFEHVSDVVPNTPEPTGVRDALRAKYPDATSIAFSGKSWAVSFMRGGKPVRPTLYFLANGSPV